MGAIQTGLRNARQQLTGTSSTLNMVLFVILVLLVIYIVMYVRSQMSEYGSQNKRMKSLLMDDKDIPRNIGGVNTYGSNDKYLLRDYYIMGSYNSCCNGNFKNSYVSLDALKSVIYRGARVLDFEVYNEDDQPVIAASSTKNYYFKGTYNSIPFGDAMKTVRDYAFSGAYAPNPNDPLFLHFRLKTNDSTVFEKMGKIISSLLNERRLPAKYNNEYSNDGTIENLTAEPLSNFMGKVVILVDKSNKGFVGTALDEVTNLCSNTTLLQLMRDYNVRYTPNGKLLMDTNKKHMAITMPDLQVSDANMDSTLHFKYGCQMICMNFQSVDDNLLFFLDKFNEAGSAFALKPAELRYIPQVLPDPKPQDKKLSYAQRKLQKSYYNFNL